MTAASVHIPVMLTDMLAALAPTPGGLFVDGTFGGGGYTCAILNAAPGARVIAFDRDPAARARYDSLPLNMREKITFIDAPFSRMADEIRERAFPAVDGIVLDLGVSSPQIDEAARGFSFRLDGPLDMRMDPRVGASAADIVNTAAEGDLADILYTYGEEKKSRAIARAIVARRKEKPFTTTQDLADLIRGIVRQNPRDMSDPATRSFQALRLYVNNELNELKSALIAALSLLREGGRLVIVTFHSLEDRIVKQFFHHHAGRTARPSRYTPAANMDFSSLPLLSLPHARAIAVNDDEAAKNPRARSAHLRVAIRTAVPLPKEV